MPIKLSWPSFLILIGVFFLQSVAFSLNADDFENLVRAENTEIKSLYERKIALEKSEEEAGLIYGWQVIGGLDQRIDKRPSDDPNFTYDSIENFAAQLGLQKRFSFGLESKLSLKSIQTEISNGNAGGNSFNSKIWETQPILDLRLPLLAGGFGRQIRSEFQSSYLQKRIEALEAEVAYDSKMNEAKILMWSTILQKELVAAQTETMNRIQKIYDIVRKKAAQNLEASSNFLQTRSAIESTELDLMNAQLKYSQLQRLLNLVLKNLNSVAIPSYDFKKFTKVDLQTYLNKITPLEKIQSFSQDLKIQSSILSSEANRSRLDFFASLSLSGQNKDWNESLIQAQKGRYPTQFVGVQWVIPLDQSITSRALERQSMLSKTSQSIKTYSQNEQKSAVVQDLVAQYNQMVDMLSLNLKLEKTQLEKLKNERQLLNQGRSSIYQVLQFELDLARAQAGKFLLAIELEKSYQQLLQYRYNSYE